MVLCYCYHNFWIYKQLPIPAGLLPQLPSHNKSFHWCPYTPVEDPYLQTQRYMSLIHSTYSNPGYSGGICGRFYHPPSGASCFISHILGKCISSTLQFPYGLFYGQHLILTDPQSFAQYHTGFSNHFSPQSEF